MPTHEISVRRATVADTHILAELFDAYRQFYEQPSDLGRAQAFISDRLCQSDSVILIAIRRDDGADVGIGFVQMYPSFSSVSTARILILNDLFVAAEAREAGVATALMDAARRHALDCGACRIELSTAKGNAAARRLYRKLGYEEDEVFDTFTLDVDASARSARS
jgi:GNAT superfamily N-acetyltransferase